MKLFQVILIILGCFTLGCSPSKNYSDHLPELVCNYFDLECLERSFKFKLDDSLRIQDLEKEARWLIYILNCDIDPNCDSSNITRGERDIKLYSIREGNSNIEFAYFFDYKGSKKCNYDCSVSVIKYGKKGIIEAIENVCNMTVYDRKKTYDNPTNRRLKNLYSSDIIDYLQQNEAKLNPWFREEAYKRGVLKRK
jgi:hypothetical protein